MSEKKIYISPTHGVGIPKLTVLSYTCLPKIFFIDIIHNTHKKDPPFKSDTATHPMNDLFTKNEKKTN